MLHCSCSWSQNTFTFYAAHYSFGIEVKELQRIAGIDIISGLEKTPAASFMSALGSNRKDTNR
jgi:hypothetical protein